MSADPILRPEFDLYMKTTTAAIASIAESTKESAKESRESNKILREYIIHNNHKHDQATQERQEMKSDIKILKGIARANSKVTNIYKTGKKGFIIFIVAAITACGGYYGMKIANPQEQTPKKVDIQ